MSGTPRTSESPPLSNKSIVPSIVTALVPFVAAINLAERVHDCHEVAESAVITSSKYEQIAPAQRLTNIVNDFNVGVKEPVISPAGARSGERIEPGMFLLVHRNKMPEIAAGTGERLVIKITGGYTETGFIGTADGRHKQTERLIGDFGKYIVNVPQGQLAKVWSGNSPKLLNEGTHVMIDNLFRVDSTDFCVKRSDQVIEHGTIHIIRVPLGSLGKVLVDSKPILLPYRKAPYVFYTAFFKFDSFASESDPYIGFNSLHLIRVPAGSLAKVWQGSKPMLLEYREEPYFFDDPKFRLEKATATNVFESAKLKHVQHGSINRLRPGVNGDVELAVVQHDGDTHFIDRFTTIDDPNHAVLGFINMGLQTHVFPSKETREERKRENKNATNEEICFEPMTTRDSLKIGLKLLVAFQVNDPLRLLKKLRMNEFVSHVENLAVSDMARAVQNSTSQNFLNSSAKPTSQMQDSDMSIADRVKSELATHLDDCGLHLVRFNIEEAKVLDPELAREMAKQALVAATASAQQAVIEQKTAVAKSNAELEAMSRRVKQDQDNQMLISAASAKLEAERLSAQSVILNADAQRQAAAMQGALFREFPELLQLELAKIQMAALRSCNVVICSEALSKTPFVNLQSLLSQAVAQSASAQPPPAQSNRVDPNAEMNLMS